MVNSTGNATVNSALDSTFGPSRGKPLAPATMSGNNIDFGAILQALIAPTANPQDANKAIGPATTNQLNKAGMGGYDPSAQINNNPYQEGVVKALKKMGEQHVTEAVSQDVPVDHIIQQTGLSQQNQLPQQAAQNDPRQALVGLLAGLSGMNAQEGSQQVGMAQAAAQPSMDTSTATTKTATKSSVPNDYGYKPDSALSSFFNALGIKPTAQSQYYDVQAQLGRQKLAGEEPFQIGDYQKALLKETFDLQKEGKLKPIDLMTKHEAASQPFIVQRDAYARMESLRDDPSAAGDLGIIFSYMKLLDPGSTVRETEQATAENARGVPDGIRNQYNRLMSGEKLTVDQRKDFLGKSGKLFKSAEAQQKKTTAEFTRLGKMNGIDPKVFIRDTGLAQESNGANTPPVVGGTFQGETIKSVKRIE